MFRTWPYQRKQDLAAVKATWRLFQQISADTKDLCDIPQNNIEIQLGDAIAVSKAGIIYVVGEVNRPGEFVMEGNKIAASQMLAMAAGPTHTAALNGTKMIRHTPVGLKDIPLPLKKVLEAKIHDIELQSDDIIWVPSSRAKGIAGAITLTILNLLLSLATYRL